MNEKLRVIESVKTLLAERAPGVDEAAALRALERDIRRYKRQSMVQASVKARELLKTN
jgi:hypothetical protein